MIHTPDYTDRATAIVEFILSPPADRRDYAIGMVRAYLAESFWAGVDASARAELERLSKPQRGYQTETGEIRVLK